MNSSILKIGKTQHVMNSFMNFINSLLVLKPNALKEVKLFISAAIINKLPKIIVQQNVRISNIIITWDNNMTQVLRDSHRHNIDETTCAKQDEWL